MTTRVIHGDCREVLPTLPAGSVQCCVTSPPYFGLRDYGTAEWRGGDPECDHGAAYRARRNAGRQSGVDGGIPGSERDRPRSECRCGAERVDAQIGTEPTPAEYVAAMVAAFREVWCVLRDDGVVFLNLGDSYAGSRCGPQGALGEMADRRIASQRMMRAADGNHVTRAGAKPKDLLGIPWLVAFALRDDGWYLRSEVIWHKPNPMPESVTDRPTSAHEKVFLLTKLPTYFYDADAIAEEGTIPAGTRAAKGSNVRKGLKGVNGRPPEYWEYNGKRNARNVWTIATQPYSGAHFATMPPALAERCILAGSRLGDTVLDPFSGAGTTGMVADRFGRNAILIELNPTYSRIAADRITADAPLLAEVSAA